MPTRIYEPPPDDSSTDIETEQMPGGRRQVVRVPQTEAAIEAAVESLEAALTSLRTERHADTAALEAATLAALASFQGEQHTDTTALQAALEAALSALQTSQSSDTTALRTELTTRVTALQTELVTQQTSTRSTLTTTSAAEIAAISSLQSELTARMNALTSETLSDAELRASPVNVRVSDKDNMFQQLGVFPSGSVKVTQTDGLLGLSTLSEAQQAMFSARVGRAYVASSGNQTAGGIGTTTMRGMLGNPAGSGRNIFVYGLECWSSGQTGYGTILINPTGNLPTTAKNANNVYVGYPSPAAGQVFFDTGPAMTGGADSGLSVPVAAGVLNKIELRAPFVLGPGVTLALQTPFGGATTAVITIYWWEE